MIKLKMFEYVKADGKRIFFSKKSISSISEEKLSEGGAITTLKLNCGTCIEAPVPLESFLKMHDIKLEKIMP
ncbi:hypothetical protein ACS5F0_002523 [Providencia rettgeri]